MVDLASPSSTLYAGPCVASESSVSDLAPRNHIETVFSVEAPPAFRITKYLPFVVDRRSTKSTGSVCMCKLFGSRVPL